MDLRQQVYQILTDYNYENYIQALTLIDHLQDMVSYYKIQRERDEEYIVYLENINRFLANEQDDVVDLTSDDEPEIIDLTNI